MSLMAIGNQCIFVTKHSYIDYYDYSTHTVLQLSDSKCDELITDICLSYNDKLLAVMYTKKVLIYEVPRLKNIRTFVLPRSASKMRFDVNNSHILVADKTGDVLMFKLNEDTGIKLLGHLSLLLNVLQTSDEKHIITSDRDEKIRVSCYPNTYNIQTYCLGHKEFVNHIELLPNNPCHLISASGDGTVKCWNYISGRLLYNIDTCIDVKNNDNIKQEFVDLMGEEGLEVNNLPVVHFTITKLDECSDLIAVAVHSYMKILVYQLCFAHEIWSHKLVKEIPVVNFPAAIKFHNLSLFIYDSIRSKVLEYQVEINEKESNEKIIINLCKTIEVFENKEVKLCTNDFNYIKQLFKRKYDNVQEYQERKKHRIEKSTG